MIKINYTADDARNDAIAYNNSLDKAILLAERTIRNAASKGCSGCSLAEIPQKHWSSVAASLQKAGYKTDRPCGGSQFKVFW